MGYGAPPDESGSNPIVEVNLRATEGDNFYFRANPEEQYIGLYHRHEDGTLMIGGGEIGVDHELIPDEIIVRRVTYTSIQETRELVSDIFYKKWFVDYTLTDEELLSLQTTIRDGKKQSGRTEDEPLVFYKKDRNTLENTDDLQGTVFDQLCEYIFVNEIYDIENNFSIIEEEYPPEPGTSKVVTQYRIRFEHDGNIQFDVIMATKLGNEFTDILNLSQLTKPKFGSRIDADRAREILDTNIFELLPNQTTRQDQINDFFTEFDNLIGPTPIFQDVDGDGVGEDIQNKEQDEQSRISFENQSDAFITRLDEQAEGSSINQGKTLESMRNRLNTYLGDVDNIIETLEDDRPEYQNISDGFLKIRKPNQAIIIRAPGNDLLEFQKINSNGIPSYLDDGFTITMWVRFVSKSSEGTLFNFGNPLQENGSGFRLETRTNIDGAGNYKRWIRLAVREEGGTLRDNHWGTENRARLIDGNNPIGFYSDAVIHQLYPNISTEDLNEWYFICATYNPSVVEEGDDQVFNKQYWLNHVNENNEIVAYSGLGAKCKVEIISRSELLRARGFKIGDLTVTPTDVDVVEDVPTLEEGNPPTVNFTFRLLEVADQEGQVTIGVGGG
jgi:hypothetical protein